MHNLNLLKFQEVDFSDYFSLVSNEKVMAQITEYAIPFEEAQSNFQKLLKRNEKYEHSGSYKVYDSSINEFIGLGHLTLDEENDEVAEIGYMIKPEYWGKGYGSEIAKVLIEKAIKSELKKLKAIIDPDNIASRKILIKQGFVSERICEIGSLPGEILSKKL
ncbi:GNAT family N-acetyltransferase [Viridibacillus sp. FSL R5-0477]|uniref:N-acetyltransferase GCN5 n=1 Tax=Viridibacillus arenosi FSL R5-213 TaxID=1227360 RepID=W4F274_9BACL|nr:MULTISPECIES: GNAT family N-acetyltransferase [Viridibacillus]ETT86161.1 N-acetyltransferase GCN5 [Viridibacillus arenosi FSL R5-213]OMC84935.1 GNAT family N-acetyltransferase [Viridibacillus sp. FSL H8-0123]OMC91980.1 GNAT family N-acetyltransferase [Viridibacillus arenosi]